jgi:hypothetical protein
MNEYKNGKKTERMNMKIDHLFRMLFLLIMRKVIYFMIDLNQYKNEMLLKVVFKKSIEMRFLFIGIFESVFLFLYQQK